MEKDLNEARKGISDKVLEEKVGETMKIADTIGTTGLGGRKRVSGG